MRGTGTGGALVSVRLDPGLSGSAGLVGEPASRFGSAAVQPDLALPLHSGRLRACAARIFDASSLWPERLWFWLGTAALVAALAALPSRLPAVASIDAAGDTFSARVTGLMAEDRPASGSNLLLTRANIRFCRFQQVRLEAIGPLTQRADLAVFQALAGDWNVRCARYRYLPADKRAVDGEAIERRETLEGEGRALLGAWRRRIHLGMLASLSPSLPDDPGAELRALPPLITLGIPGKPEAEPVARSLRAPALELLRPLVASQVQRRLNDLGYAISPADGIWASSSRIALRHFKATNGLLRDDVLDAETAARLFSTSALEAPPGGWKPEDADAIETAYPPPAGARMNPLNRDDAEQIQHRLAELGYYAGADHGLWGAASRNAVRAFRSANRLSVEEEWDAATERALHAKHALRAPPDKMVRPLKSRPASHAARTAAVPKRAVHLAPSAKSGVTAAADAPRPPAPIPEASLAGAREP
jgi:peptidoglycan hydrolase-like protein with peptidoglycan-binding domain